MAKMTRSALKGIVKECLVELLAEGLDSTGNMSNSVSLTENKVRKRRAVAAEESRLAAHRQKLETRVSDTISHATDDPIMRDILSHTARTTLQDQMTGEGGQMIEGLQDPSHASSGAGINLDSIFGPSKPNWSDLAFAENKTE